MHVAIAGAGGLSRYLCEEFVASGHEISLLSRRHKPDAFHHTGVTWCVTDYSAESLRPLLDGPEVLISAISNDTRAFVQVHEALIAACAQSPSCARFIPSEFAGDASGDAIEPSFYNWTRKPVRELLLQQDRLEWTLVCSGWLADYFVTARNRYIQDLGELFPFDPYTGALVIPGTGNEVVEFIWARDLAKVLARLVSQPKWERLTFVSAIRMTWNEAADVLREKSKLTSLAYASGEDGDGDGDGAEGPDAFLREFRRSFVCGTFDFPTSTAIEHKDRFFPEIRFRSLKNGLDEITDRDDHIV